MKECYWCTTNNSDDRVTCRECGVNLDKPVVPAAATNLANCKPGTTYDASAYDTGPLCCNCRIDLSADLAAKGLRSSWQLERCPYCNAT